jgi:uncharacterized membrane protein
MTSHMTTETSACPNWQLVGANVAAILTLLPVAVYQLGLIDSLPDPPWVIFASDKITSSKAAHPLGIPDSILGIGSYGITLGLVVLTRQNRRWSRYLKLKLVADGSAAGFNVVRQAVVFRKMCSWCTGTAVCTGLMLLAAGELFD